MILKLKCADKKEELSYTIIVWKMAIVELLEIEYFAEVKERENDI